MQSDIDSLVSNLMVQWHKWGSRSTFGKGYPSASASCKQARASRQYDDSNGALDDALDDSVMQAFDAAAYRVPQPWLTALQFQARNMACGANVWSSPRLPADMMERAVLTLEARNKLMKELARDGVLS